MLLLLKTRILCGQPLWGYRLAYLGRWLIWVLCFPLTSESNLWFVRPPLSVKGLVLGKAFTTESHVTYRSVCLIRPLHKGNLLLKAIQRRKTNNETWVHKLKSSREEQTDTNKWSTFKMPLKKPFKRRVIFLIYKEVFFKQ